MAITTVNSYLTASGLNFRSGTTGAASLLLDPSSSKIYLSGNFDLGTGSFTIGGNPIVTGSSSTEGDTLQSVTDRGSSTTNAVGIGSTSPAYKFDVVDSNGGALARFKDSDSSHAGLLIQGDTNGGSITNASAFSKEAIYLQNSASAIRFYTDGTEAVRIDSSSRVGIGTTSVLGMLQVNGRALVESPSVPTTLTVSDSGDATKAIRIGYEPTWDVGSISASDFGAGWKDIVIAPIAGKVGIGTTSPHQALSVKGTIVAYNTSYVQVAGMTNSSNAGRFYANNAGGVTKVLLDSNGDSYLDGGNVGIGTTGPATTLDVDGLISSDQIRSKKYTSLSGSANDWFPIGSINEHQTGPVLFQVITAYHSNMSFIVAKGYAPSQEHSITLLSSIDSNNTGYANIKGVRVRQDGQVEIQLYWASGPSVVVNVTARSTTDPVSLPSSLATSTSSENVVDTVTNEDGKLRSRKLITTSSNVQLSDNGISYLNGGNVGIGTTNPARNLSVASSSTNALIQLANSTTTYAADNGLEIFISDTNAGIVNRENGYLRFDTSNTERVRIAAGGKVGIGTTDPQELLHIDGVSPIIRLRDSNAAGTPLAHIDASDGALKLQADSSDETASSFLTLEVDGSEHVRVASDGNVGIGVTNPSSFHSNANRLVVGDGAGAEGITIFSQDNNAGYLYFADGTAGDAAYRGFLQYSHSTNNLSLGTAGGTKLTIASDGSVGIGSTSPLQKLDVAGVIRSSVTSRIQADVYNNSANSANIIYRQGTSTIVGNNSDALVVLDLGNVGIGSTSPDFKLEVTADAVGGVMSVRNASNARDTFRSENAAGTRTVNIGNDSNGHGLVLVRGNGGTITNYIAGNGDSYFNAGSVGIGTTDPSTSRVRIKGGTSDNSTNALQCIDSSSTQMFYVRNDGVVAVDKNYFYVVSSAGAYVQTDLRVRGSLSNDAGTLAINGDVNFDSNTLYVDSSNNRIGIGTTSPSSKLEVDGDVTITNKLIHHGDTDTFLEFTNNTITLDAGGEEHIKIEAGGVTINEGGQPNYFRVEGDTATHALFVNGGDNHVGIGTSTPVSDFTVYSSDSNSATASIHCINNNETGALLRLIEGNNHQGGFLQFDGSANKFNIGVHSTNDTTFANDTKAITIDRDTASVGIGTTDPSAKFHAEGSMIVKGDASWAGTDNQNGAIFMNTAGRGLKGAFSTSYARNLILSNSNYIDLGEQSSLVYGFRFYAGSASSPVGTYDFFTSGSNSRLHIEKGGDVGIGTTDPTEKLHVYGGDVKISDGTPVLTLHDTSSSALTTLTLDGVNTTLNNAGSNGSLIFSTESVEAMRIDEDGKVGIGTTNPSTLLHLEASDPVLKIRDSSTTTAGATLWLQESDTYGVKINYQSNGGDHGRDFLTIDTLSAADSNNQAGNHDNAWGIDQDGYVMPHKGAVDGNLLKSYEWLLYGSQVSGSTPSFPRNGTEAENSRIYGNNPFGEPAILWYTPSQDSSDNDDGGWNSDTFIIDRGKSYRTSVWVKKTTTDRSDGNLYLGTSYVDNLNGTYNTNPYFIGGTTMASAGMENDQWYLMVGYIYDSGHTGTTNHPKGGIYDRNGKKLTSATSFKFTDSGSPSDGLSSNFNKSRQRVYNYYDATTGSKTYWWGPRFEPLEASTPTLQEVLNTPSSDTGAFFAGNVGIGTTGPSSSRTLHVQGDAEINTNLVANTAVYTKDWYGIGSNDQRILTSAGTAQVTIKNGGNVGIGLTNPSETLVTSGGNASFHGTAQGYVKALKERANVSDYDGVSSSILALNNYYATQEYGLFATNNNNFRIQRSGEARYLELAQYDFLFSGLRAVFNIANQAPTNLAINLRNESSDEVGFYSPATNEIGFVTDRTERMRIDDVGNVGIGTTNPADILTINQIADSNGIRINGYDDHSSSFAKLFVKSNGHTELSQSTNGADGYLKISAENYLQLNAGTFVFTDDEFRIYDDGQLSLGNGADFKLKYDDSTDKLKIHSSSNDGITMDTAGKVGIGTTNPADMLMIRKDQTAATKLIISNGGTANASTSARLSFYEGTSEKSYIERRKDGSGKTAFVTPANDNPFVFENADGEFLRLTNSKVGIGTTVPAQQLEITKASTSGGAIMRLKSTGETSAGNNIGKIEFYNSDTTDNSAGVMASIKAIAGPSGGEGHLQFLTDMPSEGAEAAVVALHLHSNANVGIGTTSPQSKLHVEGTVQTKVFTIGALPSASPAGQRAMVSDSYYTFGSSSLGQTVYAGGSAVAPVYSDGSYWRYG